MMNNNDSLEKKNHYNLLYGYYQGLFTEKQRAIFDSYYGEDYSLSEIADIFEISRNAVWDALKKMHQKLEEYENILHLVENNQKLETYLLELEQHTNEKGKLIINKIREME